MKNLLRLLPVLALACLALRAAAAPDLAAVLAAVDDARVAAAKSADPAQLDALYSDDLHYTHSNGKVDTKKSYIDSLVSHRTVYEGIDYQERHFSSVAPGVALMHGRAVFHVRNGDKKQDIDLTYLAVWREENGRWRFLAWQSCKLPAPAK